VAFTDDDVRPTPDWVAKIKRAVEEHPDVACVGGRVLPNWPAEPPRWLTREHWSPLALVDYGDTPSRSTAANPFCLIGANAAFRRRVFERIGLFAADCQRVWDGIGSTEDHEILIRLWRSGGEGLYVPEIVVIADVQPERLTKVYHRRWHAGHGKYHALMRAEELERSAAGRLFDVPAHLYRQALVDSARWGRYLLQGDAARAFKCETRLRFFTGFFSERRQAFLATCGHGVGRELGQFLGSLARHWLCRSLGSKRRLPPRGPGDTHRSTERNGVS
jgi:GT2 family glycosyltransferase